MQNKPTRVAIGMGIIGIILVIIGIGLFLTTFINFTKMISGKMELGFPLNRGFAGMGSITGFSSMPSFIPAIVGGLLAALGSFLVKSGLGVGFVGNYKAIGRAFRDATKPSGSADTVVKIRCLNCKELNDETAKYCSACGKEM